VRSIRSAISVISTSSSTRWSAGRSVTERQSTARSEEFAASGKDAMEMGIPFTATFVELSE
jgi:hypothetical protein